MCEGQIKIVRYTSLNIGRRNNNKNMSKWTQANVYTIKLYFISLVDLHHPKKSIPCTNYYLLVINVNSMHLVKWWRWPSHFNILMIWWHWIWKWVKWMWFRRAPDTWHIYARVFPLNSDIIYATCLPNGFQCISKSVKRASSNVSIVRSHALQKRRIEKERKRVYMRACVSEWVSVCMEY